MIPIVALVSCGRSPPASPPPPPPAAPCALVAKLGAGLPVPRDASRACHDGDRAACVEGCEGSTAYACYALARLDDHDQAAAARSLRRACELGAARACSELGALAHDLAHEVDRQSIDETRDPSIAGIDLRCAAGLFEVACTAREPVGCARLGRAYVEGRGVERRPARGRTILEAACDRIGGEPCLALAELLAGDALGPPSPDEAARARARACDTGVTAACAARK